MKRSPLLLVLALVFFAACSEQPSGPAADSENALGKSAPVDLTDETIDLKDRYIVVFKESAGNVDELVEQMTRGNGSTVHYRYRHALKGFAATIPPQAVEGLRRNPNVAYIEPDGMMYAIASQSPVSSWGLDRIDQRALPVDNTYNYANDASGIKVYIIDTGIRYDHVQFNGRAVFGFDAFGGTGADGNGHGTHVAGTVGGSTVGVAKAVTLVAVRVLNDRGSGTTSGVIAGVDYVRNNNTTYAVANMSLGGGFSSSLNAAVQNAINDNVTFAVAAGNESADASTKSPASVGAAITVGATTGSDSWATYSNYGNVVDIVAPGSSIYSAWKNSSTSYNTISGTSMATPHVAGVAALYLDANPSSSPAAIRTALVGNATNANIQGLPSGTTNLLLYSAFIGGGSSAPTAPSNAVATYTNGSITLTWSDNSSDEDGFKIERAVNGGSFSSLATGVTTNTHTDNSSFVAGYSYAYRVSAYKGTSFSAWANSNTVTLAPVAPVLNAVGNITASSMTLSWGDVFGESSYVLERSTDNGSSWTSSQTLPAATTSYTWTGLSASTRYDFQVKAVNSGGSSTSNTVFASTAAAPTGYAYISAATASSVSNGNKWTAILTVTVMDGASLATGGTVSIDYDGGATGSGTAAINGSGVATFSVPNITKNKSYVDFTVTNVTGTNLSYNTSLNLASFPVRALKP